MSDKHYDYVVMSPSEPVLSTSSLFAVVKHGGKVFFGKPYIGKDQLKVVVKVAVPEAEEYVDTMWSSYRFVLLVVDRPFIRITMEASPNVEVMERIDEIVSHDVFPSLRGRRIAVLVPRHFRFEYEPAPDHTDADIERYRISCAILNSCTSIRPILAGGELFLKGLTHLEIAAARHLIDMPIMHPFINERVQEHLFNVSKMIGPFDVVEGDEKASFDASFIALEEARIALISISHMDPVYLLQNEPLRVCFSALRRIGDRDLRDKLRSYIERLSRALMITPVMS